MDLELWSVRPLWLTVLAALWGAAAGLLVPRAAYRFAVEPDEAWRTRCPDGHVLTGAAGGWLGLARCPDCAQDLRDFRTSASAPGDAGRAPGDGGRVPGDAGRVPGDAGRMPGDAPTAYRYGPGTPLVALATAGACAGLALATGARPELAVWLLLAPLGVLLAVVDFRVQRLPDVLTLPLAGLALVLLGVMALVPEHAGEWPTALFGSLVLGGAYFLLFLVNPNGMGFGDVKLALGIGAVLGWYGWGTVVLGTFAGFLFGGLYGLGLVLMRRAGRKTSIPFGPFLIAGAYVGLLIGAYAA
ncbi:prepilin peptidase [Streptomyces mirabilis]|uniref:Leader peptidase (Prepilin peptidase) / N-methyltransferase n=1 Tax=Streptomyces mirabilis TaxID=68239 RepID=A0A1I2IRX2_9ACTN|nr:A24 family peptidase [Streptomyces mirabilis]SFF43566.1 leader peptidase (prepilin peptidase) / N-methyltransferase [Streptomyces mirabilis]